MLTKLYVTERERERSTHESEDLGFCSKRNHNAGATFEMGELGEERGWVLRNCIARSDTVIREI